MMGCVDTGALIFAEAGLLDATPAATHFEALSGYRDTYDDRMFADRLFDVSESRCSSAGGVATFDMALGLIARYCGRDLSHRVAEILTYRPTEFEGPQQKLLAETSIMRFDPGSDLLEIEPAQFGQANDAGGAMQKGNAEFRFQILYPARNR